MKGVGTGFGNGLEKDIGKGLGKTLEKDWGKFCVGFGERFREWLSDSYKFSICNG